MSDISMGQAASIFVSYRIKDTLHTADRLAEKLQTKFGKDQIFFDRRTIDPGETWDNRIEGAVKGAKVVLVLIGKQWLTLQDEYGRRRIDNQTDWVRREVEEALKIEGRVVPVLVDDALHVPAAALIGLPNLVKLASCQAAKLRAQDWDSDINALVNLLKSKGLLIVTQESQLALHDRKNNPKTSGNKEKSLAKTICVSSFSVAAFFLVIWCFLPPINPGKGVEPHSIRLLPSENPSERQINAGELNGVYNGAVLEVYASPNVDATATPLATVQVIRSELFQSSVGLYPGSQTANLEKLPNSGWCKQVEKGVRRLGIRLAMSLNQCPGDISETEILEKLEAVKSESVSLCGLDESPDWILEGDTDSIFLLKCGGFTSNSHIKRIVEYRDIKNWAELNVFSQLEKIALYDALLRATIHEAKRTSLLDIGCSLEVREYSSNELVKLVAAPDVVEIDMQAQLRVQLKNTGFEDLSVCLIQYQEGTPVKVVFPSLEEDPQVLVVGSPSMTFVCDFKSMEPVYWMILAVKGSTPIELDFLRLPASRGGEGFHASLRPVSDLIFGTTHRDRIIVRDYAVQVIQLANRE